MTRFTARNRTLKLFIALALVFCLAIQPISVFADGSSTTADAEAKVAEMEEKALAEMYEDLDIDPNAPMSRAHISYYPVDGASSGWFDGSTSDYAKYTGLPSGTMKFSYAIDGGDYCYLEFYHNTNPSGTYYRVYLDADNASGTGSIYLPYDGTYCVQVYYPHGNANSTIYYAFNLYRD